MAPSPFIVSPPIVFMADGVSRFGVSLPNRLLNEFDTVLSGLGYASRSKALADAVTEFISQKRVAEKGRVTGTVSYMYDHHVCDVNGKLVKLQHGYEKCIRSVMHSHITHDDCVEVLIVEGMTKEIQNLFGGLSAIRGVKSCKLSVLSAKG